MKTIIKTIFSKFPILVFTLAITMFAFHAGASFTLKKETKNIRIITWNMQSFNGMYKVKTKGQDVRNTMMASINRYHPDIICMQEFNNNLHPGTGMSNIDFIHQV